MEFHGVVDYWSEGRGFGFVKLGDGRRIFCHVTALRHAGLDKLRDGQRVEVDIETASDGRVRVAKIALVDDTPAAAGQATRDAVWTHPGADDAR